MVSPWTVISREILSLHLNTMCKCAMQYLETKRPTFWWRHSIKPSQNILSKPVCWNSFTFTFYLPVQVEKSGTDYQPLQFGCKNEMSHTHTEVRLIKKVKRKIRGWSDKTEKEITLKAKRAAWKHEGLFNFTLTKILSFLHEKIYTESMARYCPYICN